MEPSWAQAELTTPAVVVDVNRLDANIEHMAADLRHAGVGLRPHAKTHKCPEIAKRQLAAGACGLTVATLHEAEVFAGAGANDIFIAFPIWAGGANASRVRALHERVRLRVAVESEAGACALGHAVAGAEPIEVVVEIDTGLGRTGAAPSDASVVADAARRAGLDVVGVFTHGGHAYFATDAPARAADDEVRLLEEAAAHVTAAGHDVRVISAGSTPTARRSARGEVTEQRPGTYVFGDRQQVALGGCTEDGVALVVAATVVAHRADGFVLDAGSKALSSDRRPWLDGHGWVREYPHASVDRLSEEHAVVTTPPGTPRPAIGDVVSVVPNHVCPVVNLSPELVVVDGDEIVDRWPVLARR